MRRRGLLLVLPALMILLLPSGAVADDEFELDERLMDAGFSEAYTDYLYAGDGVRVSLDFESDSADLPEYQAEAREMAEITWKHLELRVLAVDVTPSYEVDWAGGLPVGVSFTRADLEREFGPRPARLDAGGSGEFSDLAFGLGLLALGVLVLGGVAGAGVAIGVSIGRSRERRDAVKSWPPGPGEGWSGPTWSGPGWSGPAWSGPVPPAPGWPPTGAQTGPAPAGGNAGAAAPSTPAPFDAGDPWRTP